MKNAAVVMVAALLVVIVLVIARNERPWAIPVTPPEPVPILPTFECWEQIYEGDAQTNHIGMPVQPASRLPKDSTNATLWSSPADGVLAIPPAQDGGSPVAENLDGNRLTELRQEGDQIFQVVQDTWLSSLNGFSYTIWRAQGACGPVDMGDLAIEEIVPPVCQITEMTGTEQTFTIGQIQNMNVVLTQTELVDLQLVPPIDCTSNIDPKLLCQGIDPLACNDDSQCDDGIPCTQDICNLAGCICVHTPDDSRCPQGEVCTPADQDADANGCCPSALCD